MSEISFRAKEQIPLETFRQIIEEVKEGNYESRKQWKKVSKRFSMRVIKYTVGLTTFGKFIAMNATYFSDNDTIDDVIVTGKTITFRVNDSFMEMLDMGSAIGVDKLMQSLLFIANHSGIKMDYNMYNKEGFITYLKNELEEKGVEIDG